MGRAWIVGDGIDTDALAPGRWMHRPLEELAAHCLEDALPGFARKVRPGDILIAGRDFGVGSSREQAVEALKSLGVAAVVARSFAGIFWRNAINLGLPALEGDATGVAPGEDVSLDLDRAVLRHAGGKIPLAPLPDFLRELIRDGGLVPHLEKRFARERRAP